VAAYAEMLAADRSSRAGLVLRRGMGGVGRSVSLAAARRLARVAVLSVRAGLFRRLQGRSCAIARPADRTQRGWVRDLSLEAGQLQLVGSDRLLKPILHVGGRRRVILLRGLNQLRGVLELVVEPVQRPAGQVEPVTG